MAKYLPIATKNALVRRAEGAAYFMELWAVRLEQWAKNSGVDIHAQAQQSRPVTIDGYNLAHMIFEMHDRARDIRKFSNKGGA
jgi:hypothetical protein